MPQITHTTVTAALDDIGEQFTSGMHGMEGSTFASEASSRARVMDTAIAAFVPPPPWTPACCRLWQGAMAAPLLLRAGLAGRCLRDDAPVIPGARSPLRLGCRSGGRELADVCRLCWHAVWRVHAGPLLRLSGTMPRFLGFSTLARGSWTGFGICSQLRGEWHDGRLCLCRLQLVQLARLLA
jgi:hypothetical protein